MHPLKQRQAGVLLHPTSLPDGRLGQYAHAFVDFLAHCGFSVWQVLPLGPTHENLSPYQSVSAHAGNPRLIDLAQLKQQGWLNHDGGHDAQQHHHALQQAYHHFCQYQSHEQRQAYHDFMHQHHHWLVDYALFRVLKTVHHQQAWWDWPQPHRQRDLEALAQLKLEFRQDIDFYCFEQFVFFQQWQKLKTYANQHGVQLLGDLPIFIADDSVDTWAEPHYFNLNTNGQPRSVAGVPPDYFSATGQRWGNPHYNWETLQADGFQWWIRRLNTQALLFDRVRIDHFRGFEAYWDIPADSHDATSGHWVKAAGEALFATLEQAGTLPLIAEDLGIITDEVIALRDKFNIPGMKILQFAFSDNADNPYLPHNHTENCVVYTGTHDNNTTLGWFNQLSDDEKHRVYDYLASHEAMPWALIRVALASVGKLVIIPMQDLLAADSSARMNTPSVAEGNWRWAFAWPDIPSHTPSRLRHLLGLYGRL
jgi:4-alpha-glucanotransferase